MADVQPSAPKKGYIGKISYFDGHSWVCTDPNGGKETGPAETRGLGDWMCSGTAVEGVKTHRIDGAVRSQELARFIIDIQRHDERGGQAADSCQVHPGGLEEPVLRTTYQSSEAILTQSGPEVDLKRGEGWKRISETRG